MKTEFTITTDWQSRHICVQCDQPMYYHQKTGNGGICPNCGHLSKGPICDTVKKAIRFTYHYKRVLLIFRKLVKTEIEYGKHVISDKPS